jgi:outer membrane phospholipase A
MWTSPSRISVYHFIAIITFTLFGASRAPAESLFVEQPIFADAPTTDAATTRGESLDVGAATRPATNVSAAAAAPEATSAKEEEFPSPAGVFGLSEFINHFAPYEPMYFIGGATSPNVKFQFSIRYRLITPTGPLATADPWLKGFNFAYSQTSLWDFSQPQPAFFDSSYRPEFFYYLENIPELKLPAASQVGLQVGAGHESNGKGDDGERSLNIAYLRPIVDIPLNSDQLFLLIAPKMYVYVGNLSDNPDIARYRGNADIRGVFGQRDGLQLAVIGRVGTSFNRGSAQFDLTYPLTKLLHGNTDLSIDAQYFQGYGESLATYNQSSSVFRIGFSIVR